MPNHPHDPVSKEDGRGDLDGVEPY
jgi:hypothetical protein